MYFAAVTDYFKEENMTVEVDKFAAGDQQGEIESEDGEGQDNELKEEKIVHNGEGEDDSEESPQKGQKRKHEEDEDSEEESEEESDDEEQVGSLEKPTVVEGKRDRKKTMRYETDTGSSEKNKVKVTEGSGTKLQDIPRIDFNISRNKGESLKILHRVAFGRPGRAVFVKKNLRQFSGFTFTKSSEEYQKKASQLVSGVTIALLKFMCEILDIERSGTKDVLIERLLDFLLKPTDSGKPIPNKSKRKRSRTSTGEKKRKPKKKASKKKETKQTPVKKDRKKKVEEEEAVESESEETMDSESEFELEETTPEPKRKKAKTESPRKKTPQKAKKERKKSVEKKKTPAKKTPVKRQKKVEKAIEESEDDSDDEPLGIKTKRPPSDDELREVIKKILDGANLEEVTMKTVCKQVYDRFPDMDLTSRKDFIKATVKQIIR